MITFFVASDHRGIKVKEWVLRHLKDRGITARDCGPSAPSGDDDYPIERPSVDYPDYAKIVAKEVSASKTDAFGVLICGTGIGMSIAANKVPGVRAARCITVEDARLARRHNNANVLCLAANKGHGAMIGDDHISNCQWLDILDEFIVQHFEGGRHETRVNKIEEKQ